ncbi:MAG: TetR/AcrR family transcriptional regulator [Hyphomonadaceae bacterium]
MGVAERRERERKARRDTLLQAARSVLLERGVRGTTTREIADRCELSEATLFFYFKNKDEILLSLIFESIDFWGEGLDALAKQELQREQMLDEIWRFHERVYREHPEYYVISTYLAQPYVLENVSAEVKDEIAGRSGENFRKLSRLLAGAAGGAAARTMADAIWSAFLGLTIMHASRKNLGHGEATLNRQSRAKVFEMLKSGLLRSDSR